MRNDKLADKPITKEEGIALTKRVGGLAYRECSAKSQEGLGEVFLSAVAASLNPESLENYQGGGNKKKDEKGGLFGLFKKK